MKDDYLLQKIEASHQAIAKTVSDFGAIVNNNNNEIIDLKRLVRDHVEKVDKILESHERAIKELEKSDTDIRATFKGGKWMAGIAATVVLGLIGTISMLGYNIYLRDLLAINVKIDAIQAQTK